MKYIKVIVLMMMFCICANAQITIGSTVKTQEDYPVAQHKVMGAVWNTPSLWYSPSDSVYYLYFDTPDGSVFTNIKASVNFYLGKDLETSKESIKALINKLSEFKKGDAFTVKDYIGKNYSFIYWKNWEKHDFFLVDPDMELENSFGKKTQKGVSFCGHLKSLQKILQKIEK